MGTWFVVAALLSGIRSADAWPRFRGHDGAGTVDNADVPLTWSASKNVLWKTPLPGAGSSSPAVWGRKVFLTSYSGYGLDRRAPGEMANLRQHVLCFDLATGKLLWDRSANARLPERKYPGYLQNHGYASATPVTDGRSVYGYFGRSGLRAYDFAGKLLWQIIPGDKTHSFGTGGSPVLYGKHLIVNATLECSALLALDKATGNEIWRSEKVGDSWGTPAFLALPGGRTELVLDVARRVVAFDPVTGKKLWHCTYGGDVPFGSPLVVGDVAYVSGGNSRKATVAVRGGGRGDVTKTHVLWEIARKAAKIPTPLYHAGLLYCTGDNGRAYCFDATTGRVAYEQRMKLYPWASPVRVGSRIYVLGTGGTCLVLATGRTYKELARNSLADGSRFHATPAVAGHRLLIRSGRFLYCVANSPAKGPE